ncbi:hypothetical protein HAX54_000500 [Datura stramonium]|uniref:Uncharacterized protein n=1 Tax=Datura stramonium TaxID=4076 RepID=A0ABS8T154_DATST|nr:hypothetical protein [Datura stramonium]
MEATILSSYTPLSTTADLRIRGKFAGCNLHFYNLLLNRTRIPLKLKFSESSRRYFSSRKGLILSNGRKELSSYFTHQLSSDSTSIRAASGETLHYGQSSSVNEDEGVSPTSTDANDFVSLQPKHKQFRNRFLNFVRLGSVIDNVSESFFKSEIRRRLFVTAILIVISRIGYFIPLPGFDRRLIPEDYLSFVSGSVDQLGDSTPELKLSLFQLGVSPQIAASILMQVLCHVLPSLVKLRKEGLDGQEKIKSYIWWISLGFAILEALILSCYSLPYSIYAASHRVKHVLMTTSLLVSGAMTMSWICDKITESGFVRNSQILRDSGAALDVVGTTMITGRRDKGRTRDKHVQLLMRDKELGRFKGNSGIGKSGPDFASQSSPSNRRDEHRANHKYIAMEETMEVNSSAAVLGELALHAKKSSDLALARGELRGVDKARNDRLMEQRPITTI